MQIMQKGKIFEVYIGNGLRCHIDIGRETRCLFRLPSMLNHQLNDLTFFLSSVNIGKFWMGDRAKPGVGEIRLPVTKDQKLDIDLLKKQLSFSMTVKSALLNLHVYNDFDMENANPSEKSIIDLLIHGVLYHESLNCDVEFSRFHVFKVQNITIYLIFEIISDHRYLIYDFFCKIVPIQCNLNNVTVITPQFSLLTPKALIEASNIDFDFIVSSYAALYSQENRDLPLRANCDVWNFLSAFYLSLDSRFLRAAEKLNDWVISKNYVKLSSLPLLNNLHIKKESGRWNLKCEQELKYILDNSKDNIVSAIASILLGEYNRAEEYYQRLEDEKKKIFLSLPICKLWKHC